MALLSHELRNPLAPILDALNIQREVKTADPILQQAGHVIERQVGQMVRLVDDLLDVSRITTGKLRLNKEAVELRGIVNNAVEASRHSVDARRHEFSVELPTEPIWVDADPARLEQVFVNLLNNASKYTSPGGLIRVTVEREASEAVVRVRDNGTGIATEMLPHIFELFTQVDATAGRSRGGLGIGLALVGTLIEMHNGRVHVASEGLGKGSEFTVRLPTIANPPESESLSHAGMLAPMGASARLDRGRRHRRGRHALHAAAAERTRSLRGAERPGSSGSGSDLSPRRRPMRRWAPRNGRLRGRQASARDP